MSSLTQLLNRGAGDTLTDAMNTVKDAIRHQPRSQQKVIGPSEIGTPCSHCLAAKLAGWEESEQHIPWIPFIGTAVHAELAGIFETANEQSVKSGGARRWKVEQRVYVGMIGNLSITGTCDLFDTATGTVLDWKTASASVLTAVKKGPKPVNRIQAHLYGLGWQNAGHHVETVSIAHLPRSSMSINDAVLWQEPFDPTIAHAALERANRIHANLTTLAAISDDIRDSWITSQDRAEGCFSCPRYPDWVTQPSALSLELGITTSTTDRKKAHA